MAGRLRPSARHLGFVAVVWLPALAVLAPILGRRGFVLVADMVFVPRQSWNATWIAADGSVPRAVPADAWRSVLTAVVPGDLVQQAVLLGVLVAAPWGMWRLTRGASPFARAGAAVLYVWNPYVYERLAIGQWSLLVGYAALPWLAWTLCRWHDRPIWRATWLVPLVVAAVASPTGGVLAAVMAVVLALTVLSRRRGSLVAVTAVVVNLPWLVPGLLNPVGLAPDPRGVEVFAARADTPYGALASLASLGGMWKASADAPGRDVWVVSGLMLLGVAIAALGWWWAVSGRGDERGPVDSRALLALGVLGVAGLLLAWLPTTGPGADLVGWCVQHVPGAGLVRDSQKWVALLAVPLAIGWAQVLDRLRPTGDRRDATAVAALLGVVAPVLLLPGLAWGQFGFLASSTYPADWAAGRDALLAADAGRSSVLVLPFSKYRQFDWAHDRAVQDPAPWYFPGRAVADDTLLVPGGGIGGESREAHDFRSRLNRGGAIDDLLRTHDVGFVVVEKDVAGGRSVPDLSGTTLLDTPRLRVVATGITGDLPRSPYAWLDVVVNLVVVAVALLGVTVAIWPDRGDVMPYTGTGSVRSTREKS